MTTPNESQCPKGFLHRYEDASERKDAFIERCVLCGHKAVYRKDKSQRIDNRRYLRAHYRSFVQPRGSGSNAFRKAFGEKAWRNALRNREYKSKYGWEQAFANADRGLAEMRKEKTLR